MKVIVEIKIKDQQRIVNSIVLEHYYETNYQNTIFIFKTI